MDILTNLNEEKFLNEDSHALDYIKKLYGITCHEFENELLEPIVKRKMNNFELNSFEIESYSDEILIGQRLRIKGNIYHSKRYNKIGKNKCNYVVKYKVDNDFFFGQIEYFIEIENFFYVTICPYKIITDSLIECVRLRLPNELQILKEENYFKNLFFCCEKLDQIIIINSNNIVGKCIIFEDNNNFFLCEYINENEHD